MTFGKCPVDELILSFRQKSFSVKLELHTQILSGAKNYPDFQEFFVSQNKAKNARRSLKKCGNARNRLKCGIFRTIAGWLTPMESPMQS